MAQMFRTLPTFGQDPRAVAEIVNGIMNGKTNNTGTVTLATGNATTTTIYDERISPDSKIILIPFSDAAEQDAAPYGSFLNNTDQLAPSVGSTAVVVFDTSVFNDGIYLSDTTKLNVRNGGKYDIGFSLQLKNSTNDFQYADVWLRKNGTDIENTTRRFGLSPRKSTGDPSFAIGSANAMVELVANDYIEIAGTVSDTGVTLEHFVANTVIPRPAIPAAVASVRFIAPMAYSNVYVSSQSKGSAVVSHYANSTADKIYAYVVVG